MSAYQLRLFTTTDDLMPKAAGECLSRHLNIDYEEAHQVILDVLDAQLRLFEFPDEAAAQACAEEIGKCGVVTKVTPKR